ncbi:MAG: hypothetical protein ABIX12_10345 [Rubrivivax sp.]
MSSALNSVFGGGGIVGAALSIASVAFPPLGIATSVANMVTQAVGTAVNTAASMLSQQAGMPKFLVQTIADLVKDVVGKLTQQSNPGCDQAATEKFGGKIDQLIQDLVKTLVDNAKRLVEDGCEGGGKAGGKGKTGSGSWLVAMARAMGEAAGVHAKRMVELSNEINDLATKDTGGDKDAQAQNAQQASALQGEFQAESQMFSMLQNAFSNAIKSIGEGMTTMARKG